MFKTIPVRKIPKRARARKPNTRDDELFSRCSKTTAVVVPIQKGGSARRAQSRILNAARKRGLEIKTRAGNGEVYVYLK